MIFLRAGILVTLAAIGAGLAVAVDSGQAPAPRADPMRVLTDRACACQDAACADRGMNDVMELGKQRRDEPASNAEAQSWVNAYQEIHACVARVAGDAPPPRRRPPPPPKRDEREQRRSVGVAECDTYLALLDRFLECRAVPEHVRSAAREGAEAMAAQWATIDLDDHVRVDMPDHCRSANLAVRQSASALGCPL